MRQLIIILVKTTLPKSMRAVTSPGTTAQHSRLSREFANGWEIGGFFTKTDVSAADFGEGSFDKGFFFKAPLDWFTGSPSKQTIGQNIRLIQRDGGQRVYVPKRLYNQVRSGQQNELLADWGRVWE